MLYFSLCFSVVYIVYGRSGVHPGAQPALARFACSLTDILRISARMRECILWKAGFPEDTLSHPDRLLSERSSWR